MSDDRTEDPTAKRRQEFRDEGRIVQSRDVAAVGLSALVVAGVGWFGAPMAARAFARMSHDFGRIADVGHGDAGLTKQIAGEAALEAGVIVLLASSALAAAGIGIGIAQTGGLWSSKLLAFKLDRIGLLSGLARTFASSETLTQLGLTIAKGAAIGAVLWWVLADELIALPGLAFVSPAAAVREIGSLLRELAIAALGVTAVLAAADYVLSWRRIHEQLRMTKQEVKDEHKQQEGDPQVRGRMRARMRQIGRNRMLAAVRTADVVVVNPTHYAVALSYDPKGGGAPKLVAKGVDHLAAKIREVARKHQVPIIANPPVARAIHATGKVGREIPAELYEVVARILAYVWRMTRWRKAA